MNKIETYWKKFLLENASYKERKFTSWHFCDNKKDADELAVLVKEGTKRATASLKKSYEMDSDPLPEKEEISIITNWEDEPQCIIEILEIHQYVFRDVPAEFAEIEGEGDKSLSYWKKVHREAFGREAAEYGYEFNEDLTVICEEFKVIYI